MATSLAYRHLGLSRPSDVLFNPVDNSLFETRAISFDKKGGIG
jgi:hypothetical protein